MRNKYYDPFEFERAVELMDFDPYTSLELFKQYLTRYPNDYSGQLLHCSNLIVLGRLSEAEEVYNQFEEQYINDDALRGTEKDKKVKENKVFSAIKLLSYQKKYEELYNFCMKNLDIIVQERMGDALFYAKKMTGRLTGDRSDESSYLFSQISSYDEKDFFEHIKKHLQADIPYCKKSPAIFREGFPIESVVSEVKKYIPSDKKLLSGFYDNIYFFKYDSCGRVDNKVVDYFKVVCFADTQDIITIYPVVGSKNLPYVDLNYLEKEESLPKVKRLSQIDKFNNRFNIK